MRAKFLVAAAAVASHATALAAGFTWLDHGDLEQGAALAPPSGWLALFAHGYARTGFYRPLTALSLSIDALGGSPLGFHATSLALHAAAAVLVVVAAQALGLSKRAAAGAGLLFAVHPVTAVVANQIVLRGDSLAACVLLAMVAAHLRGRPWVAAAALAAGGLCKETALVLGPLFLVALEVCREPSAANPSPPFTPSVSRASRGRSRGALALRLGAPAAGLAAALGLRFAFAPAWRSVQPPLTALEAVGTRLASLAKSALALALPIDRRLCDAFPVTLPWHPSALAGLAVAGFLGWLAWRRRGPALLLAASVLPALNLVAAPRFWSAHYLYLPSAFAAMLVAERLDRRSGRAIAAFGLGVTALGAATLADSWRYRDDAALFGPEVAGRPACREAALYLGDALRLRGDLPAAAAAYEAASTPAPGFLSYSDEAAALQNLGLVRLAQGQHFEAELAFEQALERQSDPLVRRQLAHDLAAVAVARGDPAEAARLLRPEADRPDPLPESILLLARALRDMGREEDARAVLSRLPAERR